ncbi:MAG: YabP/YqfC family sporulation protein [Oscillospiraceae bacterium]|nr:YabP/YqfC family sporulation protein [Oscillospiraceae bacterium]
MRRNKNLLNRLPGITDLPAEPIPGQPVLELLGDNRVLIEKHRGVWQYSCQCVSVGTAFGSVCVCGNSLELMHMSKEQLVISGKIDSIAVCRKG